MKIELDNGKYTIIRDESSQLTALRYGSPWRDLTGDNLIHELVYEVERLREELASLKSESPKESVRPTLHYLNFVQEFAKIRRGIHPAWTGDRINNSEHFLFQKYKADPIEADNIAYDIQYKLDEYSEATGLPLRSLEQAQRILSGAWVV